MKNKKIKIDKKSNVPLYTQLARNIRELIVHGEMAPGYRLPSERKLADELSVNRTTVINAYRELKSDGLLVSKVGQGTVVADPRALDRETTHDPESSDDLCSSHPVWEHLFSDYSNRYKNYSHSSGGSSGTKMEVDFSKDIPGSNHNPRSLLQEITTELGHEAFDDELESPIAGYYDLRRSIASMMNDNGIDCCFDELMVLSGSQQGIDLGIRAFVNPGDCVFVEEPTFYPAIQSLNTTGAKVVGIPLDEEGMVIDGLEERIRRYRPKLIYTIPSFQNPTGTTMTVERRKALLVLARKYNVLILEDDAYGTLSYDGNPPPSLKSMENSGYVIYISSFSKIVSPGLRLGWMVADSKVIKRMVELRQIIDHHTSAVSQKLAYKLLENPGLNRYIEEMILQYRVKREAIATALRKNAPSDLKWIKPAGGYFLWCELPKKISSFDLLRRTHDQGVSFTPGNIFFTSSQDRESIRLNFVYPDYRSIDYGVETICDTINSLR